MVQIVISSGGTGALAQWVLLELQGEVEPRQSGQLPGSLLGDLHYTCEVRPHTAGTWVSHPGAAHSVQQVPGIHGGATVEMSPSTPSLQL
uniref:Uncharacterized protein n=1 Tax=Geospiza parvula TaxID=87175 RepID=A0A8U8ALQ1_GEOPR